MSKSIKPKQHKRCFIISPIGTTGSIIRDRSDKLLQYVFKPVCKEKGFITLRADEIQRAGMITKQIIEELLRADLVIADLSGQNPNVYYELAIRHFVGLPSIQLVSDKEKLPFDVSHVRTIMIDHRDLASVEHAKVLLGEFIDNSVKTRWQENPITETLRSIGLRVPLMSGETKTVAEQFQSIAKELLNELIEMRRERDVFRDKAIHSPNVTSRKPKWSLVSVSGISGDLTGVWDSQYGPVKIVQSGSDLYGDYQPENYQPEMGEYAGSFVGTLIGTRIFAKWKEGPFEGVAFWGIKDNSNLIGQWWGGLAAPKYEELLKNPDLVNKLPFADSRRWNLIRQREQSNRHNSKVQAENNKNIE